MNSRCQHLINRKLLLRTLSRVYKINFNTMFYLAIIFQLNKNLPKPPKYFNVASRLGQIFNVRLRMQCSAFNANLYQQPFLQIPTLLFQMPTTVC